MSVAIIVTTYNSTRSLELTLHGLLAQTYKEFQVVVADDGSGPETKALLQESRFTPLNILHVWQEDRGYRRQKIVNAAIKASDAEYLIFIDGDMVCRKDFVESHLRYKKPGCYVSGGRPEIPQKIHEKFTPQLVDNQSVFDLGWYKKNGFELNFKNCLKLSPPPLLIPILNFIGWRYAVFFGCNASAWKGDLLKINGFDESFMYGSDDRDVGVRLRNVGVRCRYKKYSFVALHLGHSKPYRVRDKERANRKKMKRRYFDGTTWIDDGIVQNGVEQEPLLITKIASSI